MDDPGGVDLPPPSPLTGCYLLIVIGEPHNDEDKERILQGVLRGLRSWDSGAFHVDLEKELATIVAAAPEGETARNGERLIQFASENLVTEILIHPQMNTLMQCIRNMLSSFTRHRQLVHAGYNYKGNGSWIMQDGTFSVADFEDAFQENEVQRVIRAYENTISISIICSGAQNWTQLMQRSSLCQIRINPLENLDADATAIKDFVAYLEPYILPASLDQLLVSSDIVGNIRFSHPTLYVFPGGQGDAALFGINGFNMLVDGGFARKACWWDFVRHLDRLDAVMMTRINNCSIAGMAAVMQRKAESNVYPQIGHFFTNIEERQSTSADESVAEPLQVSLHEEGSTMMANLKSMKLKAQQCYRSNEPINLYHKVGHGTLDMYVLNPEQDSRQVKDFLAKWQSGDSAMFSTRFTTRRVAFPVPNLVSICALLVWRPADPDAQVTRLMFPGSTPQHKIFEGLEKLQHLTFLQKPICTTKSLEESHKSKLLKTSKSNYSRQYNRKSETKHITSNIQQTESYMKKESTQNIIDNKLINDMVDSADNKISLLVENGSIKDINETTGILSKSTKIEDLDLQYEKKSLDDVLGDDKKIIEKEIGKLRKLGDKKLRKKENLIAMDNKSKIQKSEVRSAEIKQDEDKKKLTNSSRNIPNRKRSEAGDKKSPTTPKISLIESKVRDPVRVKKFTPDSNLKATKEMKPVPKKSPNRLPAKSVKEEKNRKVAELKHTTSPKPQSQSSKVTQKKELKVFREPISRRPKPVASPLKSVKRAKSPIKRIKQISKEMLDDEDLIKKSDEETSKSIDDTKQQELDENEEQEIVKEIEAVFNRDSETDDKIDYIGRSEIEKIAGLVDDTKTDANIDEDFEEEYLIIEKEELEHYSEDSHDHLGSQKEEELHKHMRDIKESEKIEKTDVSDLVITENNKQGADKTPETLEKVTESKKISPDGVMIESLPEEKASTTFESGATTAPTLPEDEFVPTDPLKDDIVEEKHIKEETKEKPEFKEQSELKIPVLFETKDLKSNTIRDIVKTPDEVADLPLHEEVDYKNDEIQGNKPDKASAPFKDVFKIKPEIGFIREIEAPNELKLQTLAKTEDSSKPITDDKVVFKTLDQVSHAEMVTLTPGSGPVSPLHKVKDEEKLHDEKFSEFSGTLRETHITTIDSPINDKTIIPEGPLIDKIAAIPEEMEEGELDIKKQIKTALTPVDIENIVVNVANVLKSEKTLAEIMQEKYESSSEIDLTEKTKATLLELEKIDDKLQDLEIHSKVFAANIDDEISAEINAAPQHHRESDDELQSLSNTADDVKEDHLYRSTDEKVVNLDSDLKYKEEKILCGDTDVFELKTDCENVVVSNFDIQTQKQQDNFSSEIDSKHAFDILQCAENIETKDTIVIEENKQAHISVDSMSLNEDLKSKSSAIFVGKIQNTDPDLDTTELSGFTAIDEHGDASHEEELSLKENISNKTIMTDPSLETLLKITESSDGDKNKVREAETVELTVNETDVKVKLNDISSPQETTSDIIIQKDPGIILEEDLTEKVSRDLSSPVFSVENNSIGDSSTNMQKNDTSDENIKHLEDDVETIIKPDQSKQIHFEERADSLNTNLISTNADQNTFKPHLLDTELESDIKDHFRTDNPDNVSNIELKGFLDDGHTSVLPTDQTQSCSPIKSEELIKEASKSMIPCSEMISTSEYDHEIETAQHLKTLDEVLEEVKTSDEKPENISEYVISVQLMEREGAITAVTPIRKKSLVPNEARLEDVEDGSNNNATSSVRLEFIEKTHIDPISNVLNTFSDKRSADVQDGANEIEIPENQTKSGFSSCDAEIEKKYIDSPKLQEQKIVPGVLDQFSETSEMESGSIDQSDKHHEHLDKKSQSNISSLPFDKEQELTAIVTPTREESISLTKIHSDAVQDGSCAVVATPFTPQLLDKDQEIAITTPTRKEDASISETPSKDIQDGYFEDVDHITSVSPSTESENINEVKKQTEQEKSIKPCVAKQLTSTTINETVEPTLQPLVDSPGDKDRDTETVISPQSIEREQEETNISFSAMRSNPETCPEDLQDGSYEPAILGILPQSVDKEQEKIDVATIREESMFASEIQLEDLQHGLKEKKTSHITPENDQESPAIAPTRKESLCDIQLQEVQVDPHEEDTDNQLKSSSFCSSLDHEKIEKQDTSKESDEVELGLDESLTSCVAIEKTLPSLYENAHETINLHTNRIGEIEKGTGTDDLPEIIPETVITPQFNEKKHDKTEIALISKESFSDACLELDQSDSNKNAILDISIEQTEKEQDKTIISSTGKESVSETQLEDVQNGSNEKTAKDQDKKVLIPSTKNAIADVQLNAIQESSCKNETSDNHPGSSSSSVVLEKLKNDHHSLQADIQEVDRVKSLSPSVSCETSILTNQSILGFEEEVKASSLPDGNVENTTPSAIETQSVEKKQEAATTAPAGKEFISETEFDEVQVNSNENEPSPILPLSQDLEEEKISAADTSKEFVTQMPFEDFQSRSYKEVSPDHQVKSTSTSCNSLLSEKDEEEMVSTPITKESIPIFDIHKQDDQNVSKNNVTSEKQIQSFSATSHLELEKLESKDALLQADGQQVVLTETISSCKSSESIAAAVLETEKNTNESLIYSVKDITPEEKLDLSIEATISAQTPENDKKEIITKPVKKNSISEVKSKDGEVDSDDKVNTDHQTQSIPLSLSTESKQVEDLDPSMQQVDPMKSLTPFVTDEIISTSNNENLKQNDQSELDSIDTKKFISTEGELDIKTESVTPSKFIAISETSLKDTKTGSSDGPTFVDALSSPKRILDQTDIATTRKESSLVNEFETLETTSDFQIQAGFPCTNNEQEEVGYLDTSKQEDTQKTADTVQTIKNYGEEVNMIKTDERPVTFPESLISPNLLGKEQDDIIISSSFSETLLKGVQEGTDEEYITKISPQSIERDVEKTAITRTESISDIKSQDVQDGLKEKKASDYEIKLCSSSTSIDNKKIEREDFSKQEKGQKEQSESTNTSLSMSIQESKIRTNSPLMDSSREQIEEILTQESKQSGSYEDQTQKKSPQLLDEVQDKTAIKPTRKEDAPSFKTELGEKVKCDPSKQEDIEPVVSSGSLGPFVSSENLCDPEGMKTDEKSEILLDSGSELQPLQLKNEEIIISPSRTEPISETRLDYVMDGSNEEMPSKYSHQSLQSEQDQLIVALNRKESISETHSVEAQDDLHEDTGDQERTVIAPIRKESICENQFEDIHDSSNDGTTHEISPQSEKAVIATTAKDSVLLSETPLKDYQVCSNDDETLKESIKPNSQSSIVEQESKREVVPSGSLSNLVTSGLTLTSKSDPVTQIGSPLVESEGDVKEGIKTDGIPESVCESLTEPELFERKQGEAITATRRHESFVETESENLRDGDEAATSKNLLQTLEKEQEENAIAIKILVKDQDDLNEETHSEITPKTQANDKKRTISVPSSRESICKPGLEDVQGSEEEITQEISPQYIEKELETIIAVQTKESCSLSENLLKDFQESAKDDLIIKSCSLGSSAALEEIKKKDPTKQEDKLSESQASLVVCGTTTLDYPVTKIGLSLLGSAEEVVKSTKTHEETGISSEAMSGQQTSERKQGETIITPTRKESFSESRLEDVQDESYDNTTSRVALQLVEKEGEITRKDSFSASETQLVQVQNDPNEEADSKIIQKSLECEEEITSSKYSEGGSFQAMTQDNQLESCSILAAEKEITRKDSFSASETQLVAVQNDPNEEADSKIIQKSLESEEQITSSKYSEGGSFQAMTQDNQLESCSILAAEKEITGKDSFSASETQLVAVQNDPNEEADSKIIQKSLESEEQITSSKYSEGGSFQAMTQDNQLESSSILAAEKERLNIEQPSPEKSDLVVKLDETICISLHETVVSNKQKKSEHEEKKEEKAEILTDPVVSPHSLTKDGKTIIELSSRLQDLEDGSFEAAKYEVTDTKNQEKTIIPTAKEESIPETQLEVILDDSHARIISDISPQSLAGEPPKTDDATPRKESDSFIEAQLDDVKIDIHSGAMTLGTSPLKEFIPGSESLLKNVKDGSYEEEPQERSISSSTEHVQIENEDSSKQEDKSEGLLNESLMHLVESEIISTSKQKTVEQSDESLKLFEEKVGEEIEINEKSGVSTVSVISLEPIVIEQDETDNVPTKKKLENIQNSLNAEVTPETSPNILEVEPDKMVISPTIEEITLHSETGIEDVQATSEEKALSDQQIKSSSTGFCLALESMESKDSLVSEVKQKISPDESQTARVTIESICRSDDDSKDQASDIIDNIKTDGKPDISTESNPQSLEKEQGMIIMEPITKEPISVIETCMEDAVKSPDEKVISDHPLVSDSPSSTTDQQQIIHPTVTKQEQDVPYACKHEEIEDIHTLEKLEAVSESKISSLPLEIKEKQTGTAPAKKELNFVQENEDVADALSEQEKEQQVSSNDSLSTLMSSEIISRPIEATKDHTIQTSKDMVAEIKYVEEIGIKSSKEDESMISSQLFATEIEKSISACKRNEISSDTETIIKSSFNEETTSDSKIELTSIISSTDLINTTNDENKEVFPEESRMSCVTSVMMSSSKHETIDQPAELNRGVDGVVNEGISADGLLEIVEERVIPSQPLEKNIEPIQKESFPVSETIPVSTKGKLNEEHFLSNETKPSSPSCDTEFESKETSDILKHDVEEQLVADELATVSDKEEMLSSSINDTIDQTTQSLKSSIKEVINQYEDGLAKTTHQTEILHEIDEQELLQKSPPVSPEIVIEEQMLKSVTKSADSEVAEQSEVSNQVQKTLLGSEITPAVISFTDIEKISSESKISYNSEIKYEPKTKSDSNLGESFTRELDKKSEISTMFENGEDQNATQSPISVCSDSKIKLDSEKPGYLEGEKQDVTDDYETPFEMTERSIQASSSPIKGETIQDNQAVKELQITSNIDSTELYDVKSTTTKSSKTLDTTSTSDSHIHLGLEHKQAVSLRFFKEVTDETIAQPIRASQEIHEVKSSELEPALSGIDDSVDNYVSEVDSTPDHVNVNDQSNTDKDVLGAVESNKQHSEGGNISVMQQQSDSSEKLEKKEDCTEELEENFSIKAVLNNLHSTSLNDSKVIVETPMIHSSGLDSKTKTPFKERDSNDVELEFKTVLKESENKTSDGMAHISSNQLIIPTSEKRSDATTDIKIEQDDDTKPDMNEACPQGDSPTSDSIRENLAGIIPTDGHISKAGTSNEGKVSTIGMGTEKSQEQFINEIEEDNTARKYLGELSPHIIETVQQGITTDFDETIFSHERSSTPPTAPVSPLLQRDVDDKLTFTQSTESLEGSVVKTVHLGDDVVTQKISTSSEKIAKLSTDPEKESVCSEHCLGKVQTETDTTTTVIKDGENLVTQTVTTVTTKDIVSHDDGTPQNIKTTIETTTLSKNTDGTTSTNEIQTLLSECTSNLSASMICGEIVDSQIVDRLPADIDHSNIMMDESFSSDVQTNLKIDDDFGVDDDIENTNIETDVKKRVVQENGINIVQTVTVITKREIINEDYEKKTIRTTVETTTQNEYPNGSSSIQKDVSVRTEEISHREEIEDEICKELILMDESEENLDTISDTIIKDETEVKRYIDTKIIKSVYGDIQGNLQKIKTVTIVTTTEEYSDGSSKVFTERKVELVNFSNSYFKNAEESTFMPTKINQDDDTSMLRAKTDSQTECQSKSDLKFDEFAPLNNVKTVKPKSSPIGQVTKEVENFTKIIEDGGNVITQLITVVTTKEVITPEKVKVTIETTTVSKGSDGSTKTTKSRKTTISECSEEFEESFDSGEHDENERRSALGDSNLVHKESFSEDECPESPSSTKSQLPHSPRSNLSFDMNEPRDLTQIDPMTLSFYGGISDDFEPHSDVRHDIYESESITRENQTLMLKEESHREFLQEAEKCFEESFQQHKMAVGENVISSISSKYEISSSGEVSSSVDESSTLLLEKQTHSKEEDKSTGSGSSKTNDPIESWGQPLGLPSPPGPPDPRGTPKKYNPKINRSRSNESPSKAKQFTPIYMDLTYVPHHGNSYYSAIDFFKRVRARYYVFSGTEPSKEIYNALLDAKKTWEDENLEVTIIPTYDTDVLGYWVTENEEVLEKYKIDLSPSASRCTINLQDHETSCAAYRLEF